MKSEIDKKILTNKKALQKEKDGLKKSESKCLKEMKELQILSTKEKNSKKYTKQLDKTRQLFRDHEVRDKTSLALWLTSL